MPGRITLSSCCFQQILSRKKIATTIVNFIALSPPTFNMLSASQEVNNAMCYQSCIRQQKGPKSTSYATHQAIQELKSEVQGLKEDIKKLTDEVKKVKKYKVRHK